MQSTFEHRRNAVLWWLWKAENARFSAIALSQGHDQKISIIAEKYNYTGDPSIALTEGFHREASVSIELIIKAILAIKLKTKDKGGAIRGVPKHHNVPDLWKEAGLPDLPVDDQYRLLLCKSLLVWAGRYPTPKSERDWQNEINNFNELSDRTEKIGKIEIRKPISFNVEDFDKLYQIASKELRKLISQNHY